MVKRSKRSPHEDDAGPTLHGQELFEAVRRDLDNRIPWNLIAKKWHVGATFIKKVRIAPSRKIISQTMLQTHLYRVNVHQKVLCKRIYDRCFRLSR